MEIVRPAFSPSQNVPNQLVYNLPQRLGSGGMRIDSFPSGLHLLYMDVKSHEPITFVGETHGWAFGVGFSVTGHSKARSSAYTQVVSIDPGLSGHFISPGSTAIEEDLLTKCKLKVCVLFDTKTLQDLANDDEESFLPFLKGRHDQIPINNHGKILPYMSQALNQLIACPYHGKTRALFLEGKAMELLAYRLDQLKMDESSSTGRPQIKTIDVERVHYAAEILVRTPANPPNITALAAEVGMSRSKFYQCFKVVYGHSPLDHLRRQRLLVAKDLLQQGRHNVTEAAFAVGYNNLGHFARLFAAEFGIPPHRAI